MISWDWACSIGILELSQALQLTVQTGRILCILTFGKMLNYFNTGLLWIANVVPFILLAAMENGELWMQQTMHLVLGTEKQKYRTQLSILIQKTSWFTAKIQMNHRLASLICFPCSFILSRIALLTRRTHPGKQKCVGVNNCISLPCFKPWHHCAAKYMKV